MSGQNPMAKVDQTANNAQLHQSLIRDVTNQGLRYIEVGGVFGGLPEDSFNSSSAKPFKSSSFFK